MSPEQTQYYFLSGFTAKLEENLGFDVRTEETR